MHKRFISGAILLAIALTLSFIKVGSADENGSCSPTVEDVAVPSHKLRVNSWILGVDGDGNYVWQTNSPEGIGPQKIYTIEDTRGCNCEQILGWLRENYPETYGEMKGHYKFGCSISVMEEFIAAFPSGDCNPGEMRDCDTGLLGICAIGTQACTNDGYWGECVQENEAMSSEGPGPYCSDTLDNDCDGTSDCFDQECFFDPYCSGGPN